MKSKKFKSHSGAHKIKSLFVSVRNYIHTEMKRELKSDIQKAPAAKRPRSANLDAVKADLKAAIIQEKEGKNYSPIILRLAWHSAGTYSKDDKQCPGGSNGSTMRFPYEANQDCNAGLAIARDLLDQVAKKHPDVSIADLWILAGVSAIEWASGGGVKCDFKFGRTDAKPEKEVGSTEKHAGFPPAGRLPDAAQGADHIREIFYRQGFNDQEIVALSGAHTLGKCHPDRSGFDGPWTTDPLKFDNQFFKLLLDRTWKLKKWDGPEQFEDEETGKLMMLKTDIALIEDPKFAEWVKIYAEDEQRFFNDFSSAFSRMISNGCPYAGKSSL